MTTGLLERPRAPRSRDRAIPLTAEQIAELDEAIDSVQRFGQIEPKCFFNFSICMDLVAVAVQGGNHLSAHGAEDDFVDMRGDSVRLVRPSLAQLLEARRRAILKR